MHYYTCHCEAPQSYNNKYFIDWLIIRNGIRELSENCAVCRWKSGYQRGVRWSQTYPFIFLTWSALVVFCNDCIELWWDEGKEGSSAQKKWNFLWHFIQEIIKAKQDKQMAKQWPLSHKTNEDWSDRNMAWALKH